MIDRFSRWPVAVPLSNMSADSVCTAFYNNWITQFGTPLTITTDQGTQFESGLFASLTQMIGANRIRTTPYHPQSNGLVERWHRTLKAALMCNSHKPWLDMLPTVLLGLRTCYKEDLHASPADIVFGTGLRIPGEFFVTQDVPAEPRSFLEHYREHIRALRPTETAHHCKTKPFVLKNIDSCTHVFLRIDAVKRPLEPPYSGPHEVLKRLDDKIFKINVDGVEKTISVDRLKPAYTARETSDEQQQPESPEIHQNIQPTADPDDQQHHQQAEVPDNHLHPQPGTSCEQPPDGPQVMSPPNIAKRRKTVSFPLNPVQVTGGRVDVAVPVSGDESETSAQRDDSSQGAAILVRKKRKRKWKRHY